MAVAGLLAQYMSINSQLSYVELQDTRWNNMATAMSKKLSEQQNLEEKWYSSSDSADECCEDPKKELVYKGTTYIESKEGANFAARNPISKDKVKLCKMYASAKVPKFDPDLLDKYTDLDIEYSTMVAMYDTLKEELTAQKDGLKDTLSTEAQDTHLLS